MALKPLLKQSRSDSETRSFLRTLKVPSGSTDSSSELVPFAGRLCSTLAEHVSEMKSLFAESSPLDGTISALSTSLPDESQFLAGNAVLEVLSGGLSLLHSVLCRIDNTNQVTLIDSNFILLLQSTIIACLDLLEQHISKSSCSCESIISLSIKTLNSSWNCAVGSLNNPLQPLPQAVQSVFSDVPQLCSLLERTCRLSSSTYSIHIGMIINISCSLPHLIPRMLEENLVDRVIDTSKPITIPTTHARFHLFLIWAVINLITNPQDIAQNKEELKRIQQLQFERALKPAKQYLQFILQRDEFILENDKVNEDLPMKITSLLRLTLVLERELFEDGEIVETGREEWEVGWLVEKTKEDELGERLKGGTNYWRLHPGPTIA
ncbi:hypothetical protein BLNAU_16800 [Blattamonas nauphoetae]|uniref:Uncharacterized protein n=1 Tax=Blattamonas nauphoetae TaxID=2049346 RepID=A0ABQ9XBM4_9EUKA|nr:hypothetical protein BLNAU_16800 [Blattamonas nauphoetae]